MDADRHLLSEFNPRQMGTPFPTVVSWLLVILRCLLLGRAVVEVIPRRARELVFQACSPGFCPEIAFALRHGHRIVIKESCQRRGCKELGQLLRIPVNGWAIEIWSYSGTSGQIFHAATALT